MSHSSRDSSQKNPWEWSDNQAGTDPVDFFLPQRIKVAATGSYNRQGHLRDCNRLLYYALENIQKGELEDTRETQQYIGRSYVSYDILDMYVG